MVITDNNAHHLSWFSRTEDDRAGARREALDGAVNSSQLAVANQDLPTRLPSQGQPPSSLDVTHLSRHLLPDVTWSTLTTLGSDHLPIIISLSSHAPPSPRKAQSCTNFRKADWEGYTAEAERKFANTPLPTSCSALGKSLQADPRRCRKTPHPLWLCQGLERPSPQSCATSHLGERSAPH